MQSREAELARMMTEITNRTSSLIFISSKSLMLLRCDIAPPIKRLLLRNLGSYIEGQGPRADHVEPKPGIYALTGLTAVATRLFGY
jgi:hypothetical protein